MGKQEGRKAYKGASNHDQENTSINNKFTFSVGISQDGINTNWPKFEVVTRMTILSQP